MAEESWSLACHLEEILSCLAFPAVLRVPYSKALACWVSSSPFSSLSSTFCRTFSAPPFLPVLYYPIHTYVSNCSVLPNSLFFLSDLDFLKNFWGAKQPLE